MSEKNRMSEVRGRVSEKNQMSEVRGRVSEKNRMSEVGCRMSEKNQRSEVRGRMSETGSDVGCQRLDVRKQNHCRDLVSSGCAAWMLTSDIGHQTSGSH